MADNYSNLATPYDSSDSQMGQVVPKEEPGYQPPQPNQVPQRPVINQPSQDYGQGNVGTSQAAQVQQVEGQIPPPPPPPAGGDYYGPYAQAPGSLPSYEGTPQSGASTPVGQASYPARSKSSPFCWCCCFVFLLIIVSILGIGIYAYYSDTPIPVVSDIVEVVKDALGESEEQPSFEQKEEEGSPFENKQEYEMEDLDLSIVLDEGWALSKPSLSKVKARLLNSWLMDPDDYEEDDLLLPIKYEISSTEDVIEMGILYDLDEVCVLAESESEKYECYEDEYELEINGEDVECSASVTLEKDEEYTSSDPYELFYCELTLSSDPVWKKIAIASSYISDDDIQNGEVRTIIESIKAIE